jgi:hypothetical protein
MNIPRMIVARPRAVPIPLPLIAFGPTRLNLCHMKNQYEIWTQSRMSSHWCILQHVWHDKEPNHTSPDVDLI